MKISDDGIALIKRFEGCRLEAYPDPATGSAPWTIGYGWTQPIDGIPINSGMVITQKKAEELLKHGLIQYENHLNSLVTEPLNQHQFDACISLIYNIGPTAFKNSTLLRKLNIGYFKEAAEQFSLWNKSNGNIIPGLTKRRAAEKSLFLS